jgi:NADPH2:quinone reductase
MSRDACVVGTTLFNSTPDEVVTIHAGLAAGLANGTLKPVIGRTFPLAEAPASHVAVLEGGSRGKILLIP